MLLYNLIILLYGLVIRNASLRKIKAKQWVQGRKNWRENLSKKINALNSEDRIWVHCASYGEFEQGRPLIEGIKKTHPSKKIILSFFSPSGYEVFKDWPGADLICYLPLDTPRNAKDFIEIVQPKTVIFIKYEFWINLLFQLKKRGIPTYLVSATFKAHHPFFKSYGSIFRRSLKSFNILFVQDENSGKLLNGIGIKNYEVCGDTRFDRVLEIKNHFKEINGIKEFKGNNKLIIAGSTWARDEDLVLEAFSKLKDKQIKLILAPHDIEDKLLESTETKLKNLNLSYCFYTKAIKNDAQVLVLDTVGLLSRIYHYGDCAYIGGGFNEGLHNTLEPAVYGIPVLFYGNEYVNYNEAVDLVGIGAGLQLKNASELVSGIQNYLENNPQNNLLKEKLNAFFEKNANVSGKILDKIRLD